MFSEEEEVWRECWINEGAVSPVSWSGYSQATSMSDGRLGWEESVSDG